MTRNVWCILRLISICVLLLPLCSCATRWENGFKAMAGKTHIIILTAAWGEPEQRSPHSYYWSKSKLVHREGYYYTRYSKQAIYDKNGKITGYVDMPEQAYSEPSTVTHWCKIQITTDESGIVTDLRYDDPTGFFWGYDGGCSDFFPLP